MLNGVRFFFVLWVAGVSVWAFDPPTREEQLAAIGDTAHLPLGERRAYESLNDFDSIDTPGPMDWLASRRENGQPFDGFLSAELPSPTESRNKLYIQPLGERSDEIEYLDDLVEYCRVFFATDVVLLPVMLIDDDKINSRVNKHTMQWQLLSRDVLKCMLDEKPSDAFAMIAVTLVDLYPRESWNFVFGQANYNWGVGVFSFARYGSDKELVLRRSLKVMTHEFGHMYGMHHCIYFSCLMNGANHLEESDEKPMNLCPVCLRKLQSSAQFEHLPRYAQLKRFWGKCGFSEPAAFAKKRIERIMELDELDR